MYLFSRGLRIAAVRFWRPISFLAAVDTPGVRYWCLAFLSLFQLGAGFPEASQFVPDGLASKLTIYLFFKEIIELACSMQNLDRGVDRKSQSQGWLG